MATAEFTVSQKEIRDELERLARERLGLSAEEFIDRYNAGRLDPVSPTVAQLAILARLLTDNGSDS